MKNLTNEELIVKAKSGNEEALNTLFEVNSGLIQMMVRRFHNCGLDEEELISICNLGLMNAYISFDASKNYKFTTLAVRVMTNDILKILRSATTQKRSGIVVSMYESINTVCNEDVITIEDTIEDDTYNPEMSFDKKDNIHKLNNALDKLPEKERSIIDMMYFKKMPQRAMSEILGVSQPHVGRLARKALGKLRDIFESDLGCLAE